ncbi:MAG: hypothetical protein JSR17_03725 [Proteobacteria bacterium]|nr:hypothetical protein [Pseudomonadota bacterium]
MSLGGLSDEILVGIGEQGLSPQDLCFAYQATRAQTGAFAEPALLKQSIVNWLKETLSQQGETFYADPIRLGTADLHATDAPQSQAQFIVGKLEEFLRTSSLNLDQLKQIYIGINQHTGLIAQMVVPGLFNKASPLMQQRACQALANISVTFHETAQFLMAFAKSIHLNINARGEYNQTALEAKVHAGQAQQIQFLLEHGASIHHLSQNAARKLRTLILELNTAKRPRNT